MCNFHFEHHHQIASFNHSCTLGLEGWPGELLHTPAPCHQFYSTDEKAKVKYVTIFGSGSKQFTVTKMHSLPRMSLEVLGSCLTQKYGTGTIPKAEDTEWRKAVVHPGTLQRHKPPRTPCSLPPARHIANNVKSNQLVCFFLKFIYTNSWMSQKTITTADCVHFY